jgi:AmmeMemoRadiSam system protein B
VAGRFYPDDPRALRAAVAAYLADGDDEAGPTRAPKAVIAPHAGYVYSGPVAGRVYRRLRARRGTVHRVLLAGPPHRVAVAGIATSSASAFATPLGSVPIDDEARAAALQVAGVTVDDRAHADEHSLEVHLPFLVEVLGEFAILPLLVGGSGAPVLADVCDRLWGGDETVVVVSTDLSHYHDDATAKALDRETAAAIVARRTGPLAGTDACGCWAVNGLLEVARRRNLGVELVDLRTSADTAGPPDRVVGYGAFALAAP